MDNSLDLLAIGNVMAENDLTHRDRALAVVRSRGIARARDFTAAGVPLVYLRRLTEAGDLLRLGRGLYQVPEEAGRDVAHDLAMAARRVPMGVVSLLSALRFHGLTTQLPNAVWMTIPHKARTPKFENFRLEIVRATGQTFTAGVEHVFVEGVEVPIFGVAKTVADCFKHRRHVGEDVAIEALRDALDGGRTTAGELLHYASIDRVDAVMRPYLKAMR